MEKLYRNNTTDRFFYSFFFLFVILHIILIWTTRLFPYLDLPWHLAAATIVKYFKDPGNEFSKYFYIHDTAIQPNIFFLYFTSLDIFPTVEVGNKWFLTLYTILLPTSVILLIKYFKGNAWFSLLSFLFLYNYNVRWGFVGFVIAIPLFLLLYYFMIKSVVNNSIWSRVIVATFFIILFWAHALVAICGLMIFSLITVYNYRHSLPRMLLEFTVILPILIMMGVWWKSSQSGTDTVGFLVDYYTQEFILYFIDRKELLFSDNNGLFFGTSIGGLRLGTLVGTFFSGAIFILLLTWLLPRYKTFFASLKNIDINLWFFILGSFFICLFAPDRLPDQQFLYQRFGVFFFLSLIILLGVLYTKELKWPQLLVIGSTVTLHFILYTDYFNDFQKENAYFTKEILPEDTRNKRLTALFYEDDYRGIPLYQHFANYHIVWNKGIASTSLIDYRFGTVRRKADKKLLPPYDSWFGDIHVYKGDYGNMDYILVRGVLPQEIRKEIKQFNIFKTKGEWSLLKRQKL